MTRVLFDLNVVLDVLLARQDHVEASAMAWTVIETGRAEGLLPAHGMTTIHYIVARTRDAAVADAAVAALMKVFAVAPISATTIRRAVALGWPDFEDAVCAAAAEEQDCEMIVTRDLIGFSAALTPALAPEEAVSVLFSE